MRQAGTAAALALALAAIAPGAVAQTGDPDRTRRQEALAHAAAIRTAFASVGERIRVTDAARLWRSEWDGASDPPSGAWWLGSWTERGLTARYCGGVLAVYAASDELKGVGRGHREVQVAPVRGGRAGLHVILANTRIAAGALGRADASLPACMSVPSLGEDRVGLVGAVADPARTVTGFRWETEFRTVACPGSAAETFRESRRVPIQATDIRGAGDARGRDLAATAPDAAHLWPRDCDRRAGLGAQAQCGPWRHAGGLCPHVYAQAPAPAPLPDPVIRLYAGPVQRTTGSCSCPSGWSGGCTSHYEQDTQYRDFQVRPGAEVVRTWRLVGARRWVRNVDNCQPPPPPPQDPPRRPDPVTPDPGAPPRPTDPPPVGPRTPTPIQPPPTDPILPGPEYESPGGHDGDNDGVEAGDDDDDTDPSVGCCGSSGKGDSANNGGHNGGGGGAKPIVLDLDGDGVELVALEDSTAFYDINGDGYRTRMAWAAADDGFLAYDKDGDGRIAAHDELSFVSYVPGARTDLEGLRHFDTDGDGQLDPEDAEWALFRVWQDLDRDGESDPGELRSLDEAGIRSIALTSDGVVRSVAGNTVFGEGQYVGKDGPRAFWDVSLRVGERRE